MARRGNRTFLWVVVGVLAVSLLGFGTGGFTGRVDAVGTVGGREVSLQAYANALSAQMRAFEENFGQPIGIAEVQELGLDRAILGQLVTDATLDAEAARLGLSASDERVREAVLADRRFQSLVGFDREVYAEELRRQGLDEAEFEASVRDAVARDLLVRAVAAGVPAPEAAAGALSSYWGERRTVTWAPVAADDAEVPDPTPEDLRAAYEADPDAYTAPERRAVTAGWLDVDAVAAAQEIDEASLRDDYEARRSEFVQEERRLIERLVFPSEEAAAEARARLDGGEATFEALVEESGLTLAATDLGDVARADLGAAADAAFAAAEGEVVGPVATDGGPALLRVNGAIAAQETTFEEAREELRAERAAALARRNVSDAVPAIEDLVAGGATVEDLVERTDMELVTLDLSEGVAEGLAAYDAVREAVTATEPGAPTRLVELDDGGVAALRVDAVTPPELRPFEEVEAEVEAAVARPRGRRGGPRAGGGRGRGHRRGRGLRGRGPPARHRATAHAPRPRGGRPPGPRRAGLRAGARRGRGPGRRGRRRRPAPRRGGGPGPDDPATGAEREAQAAELRQGMARDLFDAFAARLQADTEVRIDDAAIAAVHAQLQ
jgi:peptidyl-prolyl cis-trans isomerase D